MLAVAIIDQRVEARHRNRHDITAPPTAAAVRPAELNVFLTPKRDAAVTAFTALYVDLGLIEKFHVFRPNEKGEWLAIPLNVTACVELVYAAGSTEMVVRARVL